MALGKVLGASSEIVGLTKVAAIVGLVIGIAIPWGIFMYQALSGDVKVGTVAFNTALAFAIASTIVAIVMFALSLTVIGFIVTAVLGFVDLLLMGLCEAGVSGACLSLVGALTGALAKFIYSSGSAIDFDHVDANGSQDLVRMGAFALNLANPNNGFMHGNQVSLPRPYGRPSSTKCRAAAPLSSTIHFSRPSTCARPPSPTGWPATGPARQRQRAAP